MGRPAGNLAIPVALALGSAGVTAYQIALMRLFSYVQWYHFAYMMVSLALLGFGASGALLIWGKRLWERTPGTAAGLAMAAAAAMMPLMAAALSWEPLRFDLYLVFVSPAQMGRFAFGCFLLFLPFLSAAIAIGLLLTCHAREASGYYFANLTGTAVGGFLGLLLAAAFMPAQLPALCGLPLALGAALLVRGRNLTWVVVVAIVGLLALVCPPDWRPSPFKSLSQVLAMPGAVVLEADPGMQGMVHLVDTPTLHAAPGLSLTYQGAIPQGPSLFVDAEFRGMLQPAIVEGGTGWEEATTEALPYWLLPNTERVLFLGLEGGLPMRLARRNNVRAVIGVDPHRTVVREVEKVWSLSGIDSTEFQTASPRVALERASGSFDLIRFPTIGDFHGGVGLHSLGADYLLTKEAVAEAWLRLSEQGAIAVTVWLDFPERKALRLHNLLDAGARLAGVKEPTSRLTAVRGWGALTYVLLKNPLTDEQAARVESACERWDFDLLWLGGHHIADRERFHALESDTLFRLTDAILEDDQEQIAAYPFVLDAPDDHRPFFSQFLRFRSLGAMLEAFSTRALPFFELGSFILLATLGLLVVFASLFILTPLPWLGRGGAGKWATGLYFGSLGLAYLAIEIVMMQVFHLVWGDPILAAGGTIAGMLLFSGFGSLASSRLEAAPHVLRKLGSAIAILLLLAAFTAVPLARALTPLPAGWAYPLSLLLLALISTPLGGMFPLGLRLLSSRQPHLLPWAWGVNGALSVVSSPLALIAVISVGMDAVLVGAAVCYLLAASACAGIPRRTEDAAALSAGIDWRATP